jgi:hypothetical protein
MGAQGRLHGGGAAVSEVTDLAHNDHGSGSALRRSADPEQREAVFAELAACLAPVCRRRDLRANGVLYVRGSLMQGVAGNCWSITEAVGLDRPYHLHHLLERRDPHARLLERTSPDPNGLMPAPSTSTPSNVKTARARRRRSRVGPATRAGAAAPVVVLAQTVALLLSAAYRARRIGARARPLGRPSVGRGRSGAARPSQPRCRPARARLRRAVPGRLPGPAGPRSLGGPTVDPTWVITDRPVVRSVFTDIEIFQ